jgi:hypothetical protein
MRFTPRVAVNQTARQVVSLVTSVAVALTMIRFATAHAEAERARQRRDG